MAGCTSCGTAKSLAKECPKCGRTYIGEADMCGWCASSAAKVEADLKRMEDENATIAEIEETK